MKFTMTRGRMRAAARGYYGTIPVEKREERKSIERREIIKNGIMRNGELSRNGDEGKVVQTKRDRKREKKGMYVCVVY